jgi:hypothetical protein
MFGPGTNHIPKLMGIEPSYDPPAETFLSTQGPEPMRLATRAQRGPHLTMPVL